MSARLASHVEVSALVKRVDGLGGSAAVLTKGERDVGAILLTLADRGVFKGLVERRPTLEGRMAWHHATDMVSAPLEEVSAYLARRSRNDPDLWIVELDIVGVERFAAEMVRDG